MNIKRKYPNVAVGTKEATSTGRYPKERLDAILAEADTLDKNTNWWYVADVMATHNQMPPEKLPKDVDYRDMKVILLDFEL